jgi:hypothetical protein
MSDGSGTKVTIENKFKNGFRTARLTITRTITDSRNNEQTLKKIIWQSNYDYESDIGRLALYRSHSGIELEDKLLDKNKEDWERELFVPICTGITFFEIRVPRGETFLDRWTADTLPPGVEVAISFAEPFKKVDGTLDVPEEEKITRTIAIDRTRKIRFAVEKIEFDEEELTDETSEPISDDKTSLPEVPKRTREVKR